MAAFCAALFLASGAGATDVYHTDYSVSLLGLRVARSQFETTVENGTFTTKGTLATAGLARLFEAADGEATVTGRFAADGAEPATYRVTYHYGKDKARKVIDFANGMVVKTDVDPAPNKKRRRWIEVSPDDLKRVVDPLSAAMIGASRPEDVCNRTLRVFDGVTRVDLKLDFAGLQPFSTKGFKGVAVSCHVQFQPVSGYRKGVFSMDYLSRQKRIRMAFATLGNSGIYAPVFAKIGTQIGDVTVYATRFEKVGDKTE